MVTNIPWAIFHQYCICLLYALSKLVWLLDLKKLSVLNTFSRPSMFLHVECYLLLSRSMLTLRLLHRLRKTPTLRTSRTWIPLRFWNIFALNNLHILDMLPAFSTLKAFGTLRCCFQALPITANRTQFHREADNFRNINTPRNIPKMSQSTVPWSATWTLPSWELTTRLLLSQQLVVYIRTDNNSNTSDQSGTEQNTCNPLTECLKALIKHEIGRRRM